MKYCDVTVVIPNYNRTYLLERALKSIAEQSHRPHEVIIVDDCSEGSKLLEIKKIIQKFGDVLHILLLENEKNLGANHSRNRGIQIAKSKYIAFLDSDDLWMPDKLKKQMKEIELSKAKDSRPILSGTGRYRVNSTGEIIARQFGGKVLNPGKIRQSNFIGTLSCIVVESWIAKHIHGFNEELAACQDWDFFIRLTDYVKYVGVPDPLCVYVDHDEDRITLNNKKRLRAHIFIYQNYIKGWGFEDDSSKGEFFRNIAEDYQLLGNSEKSNHFYAKSKKYMHKGLFLRKMPEKFWRVYYKFKKMPDIKNQRYMAYNKNMQKHYAETQEAAVLRRDSETIKSLVI